MTLPQLIMLSAADIERILLLEQKSFIPSLQVNADKLRKRFAMGHHMYGLAEGANLLGMISFSYAFFDPADRHTFPRTEVEFCQLPMAADYNSVFLYNFEVTPDQRGRTYPRRLFVAALRRAKEDGCRMVVACPRIPSYAGSTDNPQENIPQRPQLKAAIDRHLQGGAYPSREEFLQDPLLALYYRLGQAVACRFHWVIPEFAPYDEAAGGIRVLMYGHLDRWNADEQATD